MTATRLDKELARKARDREHIPPEITAAQLCGALARLGASAELPDDAYCKLARAMDDRAS